MDWEQFLRDFCEPHMAFPDRAGVVRYYYRFVRGTFGSYGGGTPGGILVTLKPMSATPKTELIKLKYLLVSRSFGEWRPCIAIDADGYQPDNILPPLVMVESEDVFSNPDTVILWWANKVESGEVAEALERYYDTTAP